MCWSKYMSLRAYVQICVDELASMHSLIESGRYNTVSLYERENLITKKKTILSLSKSLFLIEKKTLIITSS